MVNTADPRQVLLILARQGRNRQRACSPTSQRLSLWESKGTLPLDKSPLRSQPPVSYSAPLYEQSMATVCKVLQAKWLCDQLGSNGKPGASILAQEILLEQRDTQSSIFLGLRLESKNSYTQTCSLKCKRSSKSTCGWIYVSHSL